MNEPTSAAPVPERILMTTDAVGGVWDYALELCRGLGRHGIEVILATMGPPLRQGQRIEAAGVSNVQLLESRYRLEWMPSPWTDLEAAGTWLELMEAQFAPDVVHLNGYVHAALPWSAPVLVAAHSDVLTWWQAVRGGRAPSEWDRYAEAVGRGLRAADVVVAPSRALLDGLEHYYGPQRHARVIHNARDARRYAPREKEAFVLSAGRLWDDAKNARMLTRVAADIGWPVRLAGDHVAPDGRSVALNGVELLGPRPPGELAELLARASIYALPARYEPFGLTVLEAALSRCALVLGDIPSLRELWDGAAEFVPPDDVAALRVALSRLISDPEHRARRAAEAYARAARYSVERMTNEYMDAYAAAARKAHPPGYETAAHFG